MAVRVTLHKYAFFNGSDFRLEDGITQTITEAQWATIPSEVQALCDASTVPSAIPGEPQDSDLLAIAALTTTAFGRNLLTLANAAAGRTAFGLDGTADLLFNITHGPVLTDTSDGHTYRLTTAAGVVVPVQVT